MECSPRPGPRARGCGRQLNSLVESTVLFEDSRYRVRRAEPADNEALCELLRAVHIRGALDVAQERDPDFFGLLRLHGGPEDVWLMEDQAGQIGGCGSVSVRPGLIQGAHETVGYLGDLRARPGFRGVRYLPRLYRMALEWARDKHKAELFYTVVFDDNLLAKRALLERKRHRKEQPSYRIMTPFAMTSVQFTTKKGRPIRKVENATARDRPELLEFLARSHRQRLMGEVVDEAWLDRRLATWPGLQLDSFLLARDHQGRIVGSLAPFDPGAFKRTRVLGYHEHLRWVRFFFDLGARIARFSTLPPPGDVFRFTFLSHLEVDGDDPAVFRDLLLEAYRRLSPQRLHFMSAMIPRGSPLESAFRGFMVQRTNMTLYGVNLHGSPFSELELRTSRPGFEIALA